MCVCVCVCVLERERGRGAHPVRVEERARRDEGALNQAAFGIVALEMHRVHLPPTLPISSHPYISS